MPHAQAKDGTRLYFEEAGSGTAIIFVHEFAADYQSWEPQVRYFSRRHRCVTYSARGYHPSDIPDSREAYSHNHFADDAIAVLDHLKIDKAHVVGLSMGGYSTLQVGLRHPGRARSLTLCGTGSGSERDYTDEFRKTARATADGLETPTAADILKDYALGQTRVPFLVKDTRGYKEFAEAFCRHSTQGSAHTLRGFQAERPSIYDFADEIHRIALPALIMCGDEDDPCIEPSLFLKKTIPASGLAMFPKSGHTINLEEPALFNQTLDAFLTLAEAGRWEPRDPRSLRQDG